jgi:hypothetical protein
MIGVVINELKAYTLNPKALRRSSYTIGYEMIGCVSRKEKAITRGAMLF